MNKKNKKNIFKERLFDLKNMSFKVFATRALIVISSAFILSILINLSRGPYYKTSDFFNVTVMMHILMSTVILTVVLSTLFLYTSFSSHQLDSNKSILILATCVNITFLLTILFSIVINIYIAPITLAAFLIATLLNKQIGIVTSVLTTQTYFLIYLLIFGKEMMINSSAALLTSMIASILIIMLQAKAKTRFKFIISSLVVAALTMFIPMLINLLGDFGQEVSVKAILLSGVWSFLSILISTSIFTMILPILEKVFKVNTSFRLGELTSLSNPLLKKLATEAPGTFSHSLMVGNLAELCADAIGEDTQLAKACAYYHDIGKIENPEYYIENQKEYNPHDEVIPEVSVSMIINHATAGYDMLKQAGMPEVIVDVTREHHGTTPVNYFLYKAQGYTEDIIDSDEFRYPGPRPRTKIAAIIMIVDTVEAASRAMAGKFSDSNQLRDFIHRHIKDKIDQGQFVDCDINFHDLKIIEDVLVEAVPSMFHARIKYVKPDVLEKKDKKKESKTKA